MADASKDGIILDKQWLATKDERTRDSHAHLDGEIRKWNERFSNGLRYPQDPQGEAAEVYNCRCAMREITRGFYNKYTGKTVMLADAPQDEYAAESKAYWNKYFAEKKQKESALASAENPNYRNKLLNNTNETVKIEKKSTSLPINIQLLAKKSEDYPTVELPKNEYAHIMSEIATKITEEQKGKKVFRKAIGNKIYTLENNGFGHYRVIGVKKIV